MHFNMKKTVMRGAMEKMVMVSGLVMGDLRSMLVGSPHLHQHLRRSSHGRRIVHHSLFRPALMHAWFALAWLNGQAWRLQTRPEEGGALIVWSCNTRCFEASCASTALPSATPAL